MVVADDHAIGWPEAAAHLHMDVRLLGTWICVGPRLRTLELSLHNENRMAASTLLCRRLEQQQPKHGSGRSCSDAVETRQQCRQRAQVNNGTRGPRTSAVQFSIWMNSFPTPQPACCDRQGRHEQQGCGQLPRLNAPGLEGHACKAAVLPAAHCTTAASRCARQAL